MNCFIAQIDEKDDIMVDSITWFSTKFDGYDELFEIGSRHKHEGREYRLFLNNKWIALLLTDESGGKYRLPCDYFRFRTATEFYKTAIYLRNQYEESKHAQRKKAL